MSDDPWRPVHHEEADDETAPPAATRKPAPKEQDGKSDAKSGGKSDAPGAAFTVMLAVPPEFTEAISGLSVAITKLAQAIATSGGPK